MIELYYRDEHGNTIHDVARYSDTIDEDRIHYLAAVIGFEWKYCSVMANSKYNFLENRVVTFEDTWVLEESKYYRGLV